MSTLVSSARRTGLAVRLLSLPVAILALASSCVVAQAQTAPQLLPYIPKVLAGGGAAIAAGALCPDASGNHATDAYGDGCLATSVLLSSPRYATADSAGNVFFSDYTSAVSTIRRIDAVTGIITLVGGGQSSSPAAGATCGALLSLDAKGDGCLANAVNLFNPEDIKFAANGDLYFVENGNQDVRKIAATNGLITTTGVISLVAGNAVKTSGYAVNQGATTITAGPGSTTSLLDFPASIAFDKAGNLYITDEGNEAIEVVNLNATTQVVQGVSIPPGTIAKIAGYGAYQTKSTNVDCPNGPFVSSTNRGGCYFGTYSGSTPAVTALLDAPYGLALDSAGNVLFDNEFLEGVGRISAGTLTNFAGINGSFALYTAAKPFPRAAPGTFAIGSNFGLAVDSQDNTYVSDALNGVIWRVDKGGSMYVVAGGSFTAPTANAPCPGASNYTSTDAFGDGCPATSAVFGKSGTSFASTGVYGVSVDAASNLYVGDSITNLVRIVANGTALGTGSASTILVHFAAGDSAAANGYSFTTGSTLFTATPGTCTTNSDGTADCPVTITGTPAVVGPYSGVLKITSAKGGSATYNVTGIYAPTPVTRTAVSFAVGGACAGSTTVAVGSSISLSAIVTSIGSATGTVQFLANGVAVGAPQPLASNQAKFTFNPSTPGTYTISATYSGDSYYTASTGTAPGSFVAATPTFTAAALPSMQSTVSAGQTALYSFTVTPSAYTGTIAFACSGLPAYASCQFSPPSLTNSGCSVAQTVALSIFTQQATPVPTGSSLNVPASGVWQALGMLPGVLLAMYIGVRRRKSPLRHGRIWLSVALLLTVSGLSACGKAGPLTAATPSGASTVTVTATGSAGTVATFTVPLTVK